MNVIRVIVDGSLLIFNRIPGNPVQLTSTSGVKVAMHLEKDGTLRIISLEYYPIELHTKDLIGDISVTLSQNLNYKEPEKINKRSLWKKRKIT